MGNNKKAFGPPGISPRWTGSAKDGVGTAYSGSSRVWYTISCGILNEIYYPTIDRPQIRDFQFLITDGKSWVREERHLKSTVTCLSSHALGFRITNTDPDGRYALTKEILSNPHQDCVLVRTQFRAEEGLLPDLKLYALLAPHLEVGGWDNSGTVKQVAGRKLLSATKKGTWLIMGATPSFLRGSCGYVGTSDGWTDIHQHRTMAWEFEEAAHGNIALMGEIDLSKGLDFTVGIAFGDTFHNACAILFQSLDLPFEEQRRRFVEQWNRSDRHLLPLHESARDGGRLYHVSHSLLSAHEDKRYQGAIIASMSVPWGDVRGDDDIGGYHLVWTRDMCQSATALLAAGSTETPFRSLEYLACTQLEDGGFYQNFWINGEPYWCGVQLDEVAFPILLAWKLHTAGALRGMDPYAMVSKAARYLILQGPATPQERWEENGGYSPSTLASNIAALTCAALFARKRGDPNTARFIQEYADFLERNVEAWTVTTQGTLVPGISRHYIRIQPVDSSDPVPREDPNQGVLALRNQPPGAPAEYPAKEIVDAGFLELVRYGIRKPGDRLIEDSLHVVDAVLKMNTPFGPCWTRYNHDGYGQRVDGGPYQGYGKGRPWPLLTGERAHYELAAGGDVGRYLEAMEGFAKATGLLPEQIWDEPDRPEQHLYFGGPTGGAMPLMWAHAEYVKLLRSVRDRQVFDFIPEVAERYRSRKGCANFTVWKFNRQPRVAARGSTLRVIMPAPFRLHWSADGWQTATDTDSSATGLGIHYVDIPLQPAARGPIRFTFFWSEAGRWEGKDFEVLTL